MHFDVVSLIEAAGYIGLFAIVFAESGVIFGFFLPGDSLMFTAGILASQGHLNIYILLPLLLSAAILGDNFGYHVGRKLGPRLFTKEDSWFFDHRHVGRAEKFFEQHGPKSIIISRFIPIIRTFVPMLAGVAKMNYRTFLIFNAIGAVLWSVVLTLIGYYLGNAFPGIDCYIVAIAIGIIVLTLVPTIINIIRARR